MFHATPSNHHDMHQEPQGDHIKETLKHTCMQQELFLYI